MVDSMWCRKAVCLTDAHREAETDGGGGGDKVHLSKGLQPMSSDQAHLPRFPNLL
jgi:hypothetical protein